VPEYVPNFRASWFNQAKKISTFSLRNASCKAGYRKAHRQVWPLFFFDQSLLIKLPGSVAVIPPADAQYGVQCVGLVKVWGKSPPTSQWRQGALVRNSPTLKRGTVIATFVGGIYPSHATNNHACIFIEFLSDMTGFVVLEQHVRPNPNLIQTRTILFCGIKSTTSRSNNGDAYSVVL